MFERNATTYTKRNSISTQAVLYNNLFTSSDFEIVSFEAEIIETKFRSVHSHLEWVDASYETNEELRKVCYENESKIKFPTDTDKSICDKSTILFTVLRKP